MDIYSKPITEIGYADISAFLDARYPESEILDYKRDWPKELAPSIAAFANTDGGIILLGVAEEEKTGRPVLPPVGIDIGRGEDDVARQIQSKAYDKIWHPVTPEIAVCRTEADPRRAVVLIRVAESHETPHWTDDRQRAYVRVASQNRYIERQARPEEYERLWNRREGAVRFRESLIARARERAGLMSPTVAPRLTSPQPAPRATGQPPAVTPTPEATTEAYAVPCFPDHPRLDLGELLRFLREQDGYSAIRPFDCFPIDRNDVRPIAEGAAARCDRAGVSQTLQIDRSGLVYGRCRLLSVPLPYGSLAFHANELLGPVLGFLDYLCEVWDNFPDLQAKPMSLTIRVAFSAGSRLEWANAERGEAHEIYDSEVPLLDQVIMPRDLRDSKGLLFKDCFRRLLWASGMEFPADLQKLDRELYAFLATSRR